MDDFVNALGGKENIISSSNTINALKLELKDGSKVEKDNFNKFEVHGFIKNNNSLTMIIGNNAQAINDELKK
jgi:phosphotransferase system IIB component